MEDNFLVIEELGTNKENKIYIQQKNPDAQNRESSENGNATPVASSETIQQVRYFYLKFEFYFICLFNIS